VLFLTGRIDDAVRTIDEILRTVDRRPSVEWAWWIVPAAMILTEVGRADEFLALGGEDVPSRWVAAARTWAVGDLAGAADLFAQIGSASDEAYARIRDAQRSIESGRRAEAQPQLDRALELLSRMGTTALIRRAEQLLAPPA
jgi:hypothetical protein